MDATHTSSTTAAQRIYTISTVTGWAPKINVTNSGGIEWNMFTILCSWAAGLKNGPEMCCTEHNDVTVELTFELLDIKCHHFITFMNSWGRTKNVFHASQWTWPLTFEILSVHLGQSNKSGKKTVSDACVSISAQEFSLWTFLFVASWVFCVQGTMYHGNRAVLSVFVTADCGLPYCVSTLSHSYVTGVLKSLWYVRNTGLDYWWSLPTPVIFGGNNI